jgi:hypothetical protein
METRSLSTFIIYIIETQALSTFIIYIIETPALSTFIINIIETRSLTTKRDLYKMKCANDYVFSVIRILQDNVWNNKYEWLSEF